MKAREVRKWELQVLSVRPAGEDFCWISLAAPPEWQSRPGQFINIRCDDPTETEVSARPLADADDGLWPRTQGVEIAETSPLVRRPLSICDVRDLPGGKREIVLLIRIVGPGSRILGRKQPGDMLDFLGPIGNGFRLDAPGKRAFLIGGGCGIAPLVGLGRALAQHGKQVISFYGAANAGKIPFKLPPGAKPTGAMAVPLGGVPEFGDVRVVIATEDGSLGCQGLVTDAIAAYTKEFGWDDMSFYGCGPDAMMSALATVAKIHEVASCQVSLENYMGCAIGVCLSCAAKIRADNEVGWINKFVCQDGPIFEAAKVIFENKWEGCKR